MQGWGAGRKRTGRCGRSQARYCSRGYRHHRLGQSAANRFFGEHLAQCRTMSASVTEKAGMVSNQLTARPTGRQAQHLLPVLVWCPIRAGGFPRVYQLSVHDGGVKRLNADGLQVPELANRFGRRCSLNIARSVSSVPSEPRGHRHRTHASLASKLKLVPGAHHSHSDISGRSR